MMAFLIPSSEASWSFRAFQKEVVMMRAIQMVVVCAVVLIAWAGQVEATLLMTITDAGGGNSRFVFSGSGVLVSGDGSLVNSIWMEPSGFTSNPLAGSAFGQPIISGSGLVSSSVSGTFSVTDVHSDAAFGFAPRITGGDIVHTPGATIAWSGDLISSHPFSNFNPGVYTTKQLMFGTLGAADNYVLTIGSAAAVPEPSSLALFCIAACVAGFAAVRRLGRREKQQEAIV